MPSCPTQRRATSTRHPDPPNPRLTDRQRELAADPIVLDLARKAAARYARRYPRLRDEFERATLFAVVGAAMRFQPDRDATFRTYVRQRINGALIDVLRATALRGYGQQSRVGKPIPRVVPLVTQARGDSEDEELIAEEIPDDRLPVGWEAEWADELANLTRGLTRSQAEAILAYHGRGECATMEAAGQAMGLNECRFHRLYWEAIGEVRRRFGITSEATEKPESIRRGVTHYGVRSDRPWRARVRHNGRVHELGWFNTAIDAALAYDAACRRFGLFDRLNFPDAIDARCSSPTLQS